MLHYIPFTPLQALQPIVPVLQQRLDQFMQHHMRWILQANRINGHHAALAGAMLTPQDRQQVEASRQAKLAALGPWALARIEDLLASYLTLAPQFQYFRDRTLGERRQKTGQPTSAAGSFSLAALSGAAISAHDALPASSDASTSNDYSDSSAEAGGVTTGGRRRRLNIEKLMQHSDDLGRLIPPPRSILMQRAYLLDEGLQKAAVEAQPAPAQQKKADPRMPRITGIPAEMEADDS